MSVHPVTERLYGAPRGGERYLLRRRAAPVIDPRTGTPARGDPGGGQRGRTEGGRGIRADWRRRTGRSDVSGAGCDTSGGGAVDRGGGRGGARGPLALWSGARQARIPFEVGEGPPRPALRSGEPEPTWAAPGTSFSWAAAPPGPTGVAAGGSRDLPPLARPSRRAPRAVQQCATVGRLARAEHASPASRCWPPPKAARWANVASLPVEWLASRRPGVRLHDPPDDSAPSTKPPTAPSTTAFAAASTGPAPSTPSPCPSPSPATTSPPPPFKTSASRRNRIPLALPRRRSPRRPLPRWRTRIGH